MTLEHREYDDPARFASAVRPFLMAHEAENGLLLGLTGTLARPGSSYTGRNHLALVEDDGDVLGMILMTPPFGPVISRFAEPAVLDMLAGGLLPRRDEVSSVFGQAAAGKAFAERWRELTGRQAEIALAERIYQLTSVQWPARAPGNARQATQKDRDLLVSWMAPFNAEAFGPDSPEHGRAAQIIDARLADPAAGFLIWEDGEPVAMAGYCDPTPHGIRIGPVFTPVRLRGRGYATSLTAELSQRLLDQGRTFTFLFTDLANPVSNHVYRKIGYKPVADVNLWNFSPAD